MLTQHLGPELQILLYNFNDRFWVVTLTMWGTTVDDAKLAHRDNQRNHL